MEYRFGFVFVCALGLALGGSEAARAGDGAVSCEVDEECDDDDVCTEDFCDEPVCAHEPKDDCDDNECTEDTCTDGMCDPVPVPDGTGCLENPRGGDYGGLCVAGECKGLCESAEECNDLNECTADACIPVDSVDVEDGAVCGHAPVSDESLCAGGMCEAGECAPASLVLPCSEQGIRNAIAAGGGPYTFDCGGPTTVMNEAEFVIDDDVILDGEGNLTVDGEISRELDDEGNLPVDGRESEVVFGVLPGVTAELHGFTVLRRGIGNGGTLTLTGSTVSRGGGIGNEGTMTISESTVSRNVSAIDNSGSLTMTGVTVSNNGCSEGFAELCGAIFNAGALTMTNSTVSGNEIGGDSGGSGAIWNLGDGTLSIVNSTVSGNSTSEVGGGIANDGTMTITNSTLSGNTPHEIFAGGTATVTNTLIRGVCQCPFRLFCRSAERNIVSNGYNIESPSRTCGFDQDTDLFDVRGQDVDLEPLADNGGLTETRALGPDSIAIDRIPKAMCEVDEDQRGVGRPQNKLCDVGAFELTTGGGGCSATGGGPSTPWWIAMVLGALVVALRRRDRGDL